MSKKPTIMKFGGTSVADANAFRRVASIVASCLEQLSTSNGAQPPIIVVSAISGMTDALLAASMMATQGDIKSALTSLEPHFERHQEIAVTLLRESELDAFLHELALARNAMGRRLHSIELAVETSALSDAILSCGEQLSSSLLASALRERGVNARHTDARDFVITSDDFGAATPLLEETFAKTRLVLNPLVDSGFVPVLGGFIGATPNGLTTTLGRGGSDYTAALVGAALSAREIQIWTDVSGVLAADPRVVNNARTIPRLSYAEAAELAYFGAKVLHPKTIQPAVEGNIPVRICNSRQPDELGTLVCAETETAPRTVKAIAHKTGVTTIQITSARMLGAYGFLRALFEVFDRHRTAVDVVTTSEVSVSLSLDDASALPGIVTELEKLGTVRVEKGRAIICVVGEGLRGTPGIAARVFSTISDINVTLISQGASSINLTFAVEESRAGETVTRLHKAFFLEPLVATAKHRMSAEHAVSA